MVDGIEIAAVCDNRPGRARQVAEEFGADRWGDDFADVLAMANVDVVDVSTPPKLHAPMALGALSAGKAVICEKPMSSEPRPIGSTGTSSGSAGMPADGDERPLTRSCAQ
jgi:predicted dehydrogenase